MYTTSSQETGYRKKNLLASVFQGYILSNSRTQEQMNVVMLILLQKTTMVTLFTYTCSMVLGVNVILLQHLLLHPCPPEFI
jgi:hypothetical protein